MNNFAPLADCSKISVKKPYKDQL